MLFTEKLAGRGEKRRLTGREQVAGRQQSFPGMKSLPQIRLLLRTIVLGSLGNHVLLPSALMP